MTDQPQSETPAGSADEPAALKPDEPTAEPQAAPAEPPTEPQVAAAEPPIQPPAASVAQAVTPPPPPASSGPPPPPPPPPPPLDGDGSSSIADTLEERPELAAGAAFAGGLLLALILKRLAR